MNIKNVVILSLGATHGILSTLMLLNAAFGVPAGYISSLSMKYLGYWNSLNIGSLAYAIRFLWIYLAKNPWWIVPTGILHGKCMQHVFDAKLYT